MSDENLKRTAKNLSPEKVGTKKASEEARETRLAEALRANLRRRKSQKAGRQSGGGDRADGTDRPPGDTP